MTLTQEDLQNCSYKMVLDPDFIPSNLHRGSFPWWLSGEESACQGRRLGLDPWVRRRSSGEGNGNPLRNCCLPTPMSRGAWWAGPWDRERVRHDLATKQQHNKPAEKVMHL